MVWRQLMNQGLAGPGEHVLHQPEELVGILDVWGMRANGDQIAGSIVAIAVDVALDGLPLVQGPDRLRQIKREVDRVALADPPVGDRRLRGRGAVKGEKAGERSCEIGKDASNRRER